MKLSDAYRMVARDLDYAVDNLARGGAPRVIAVEVQEIAESMRKRARLADAWEKGMVEK